MPGRIFILLVFFSHSQLWARQWHAGAGQQFITVAKALEMAMDGDSVMVHSGIYKEGNLIITKSIALLGIGQPVLDGQMKYEILSVKADRVVVSGLVFKHSGFGTLDDPGAIKIYNKREVVVRNNVLEDNFFGIYVQYGTKCVVEDNVIRAYGTEEQQIGNGIHCWKSDSLLIIHNDITGHRDGIYFEFVTHSVIWRNNSHQNIRYGLHFMFSNDDSYYTNVFKGNGAGVAVMFTKGVKMVNNVFEDNWGDAAYGILLKEISDSYIHGNKFLSNTSGIYMEGTNRIVLESNVFESNGWGMKMQASCMDNIVKGNNFVGNTFDVSTNGTLVLNVFSKNYWDKYEGYDLNRDGIGDVPFHPLSLFSVIAENNPSVMILFRSFIMTLLDRSEKVMPTLTPDNFRDSEPLMHSLPL